MKNIIYLIVISLVTISCNTSKKITNEQKIDHEPCESMTFTNETYNNIETDYYTIDSLFIEYECLNIWVSYSGGCGDAEFSLLYTDKVMQSFPPKSSLMLKLVDNDDCRAIVQQKLYYNLSFFQDYAANGGINLKLAGIDKSVMYKKLGINPDANEPY